jgi:hypothetical protein
MSCKLDAGSSNSYFFTGLNVHSTSIYLGNTAENPKNLFYRKSLGGSMTDELGSWIT